MSTPVVECEDSARQVKVSEYSNYFDIQSGGINMVWPTGISNQPPNQQTFSYSVAAPIITRQNSQQQVQVHQFINSKQRQPLNYNSSSHNYFAMYAGSPNYVMTDLRRVQGMETTIEYLRELLSKEFTNNIKEKTMMEEMKKELEASNEKNKLLQEQLQATQISIKETQAGIREMDIVHQEVEDAQKALSANQKELLDAQNELVVAQNSLSELKTIRTILESKVAELSKENEQLRPITNLSSESEKVGWCENSMSAEIHIDEENDFTALKAQYKLLKDELIATTEKKQIISNQFKELGKKYLYMIEYSGEQIYNDYLDKHMEFIEKLESLNISASKTQGSKIKQMLACLKEQVKLLEEFRENFRVTIELLMCRIDQEFALVSDLSIRAQKPPFEIPLEDFDLLFQVIAGIGSVELDCEQKV